MKGLTIWFTGLPCSGKTTIADKVTELLREEHYEVRRLDGDIVRGSGGMSNDLGFSKEDRDENIDRVSKAAKWSTDYGAIVLASFVTPYEKRRQMNKELIDRYLEVYVKCPLDICIGRDTKGMYKKALAGEIKDFTGVDDPYEEPKNPNLVLNTAKETVSECVMRTLELIYEMIDDTNK